MPEKVFKINPLWQVSATFLFLEEMITQCILKKF